MQFKFTLGQKVRITKSNEEGEVRGLLKCSNSDPQYCISYCDATGVATERWWDEDLIEGLDH